MNSKIIKAIQHGLPITKTPWQDLSAQFDIPVSELIEQTKLALQEHNIKRFGLVVKHRNLGYTANAMVVWDIPDSELEALGTKMSEFSFVRLCYQRPRSLPEWPYNLFCMIHAKDKESALINLAKLIENLKLKDVKYDVLFSKTCFKQTGARYR